MLEDAGGIAEGPGAAWLDGVTAAVLTPFDSAGTVRLEGVAPYARRIARSGVSALAVGAHTGRGSRLGTEDLAALVAEYAHATPLPVVAGVGVPPGTGDEDAAGIARVVTARALAAADAGADALLCSPPPRPAGAGPQWLGELHARLARETGLPVVGFVLYAKAGAGPTYDRADLDAVVVADGVAAVKIATLDDAVACQDFILQCRAAGRQVLTGEDRMFGPSLMWGAQGALVGLAAALPEVTVTAHDAWRLGRYEQFPATSARLDELARLTFGQPYDGYVQRMAWAAQWEGALPAELAHDPWCGSPESRDDVWRGLDAFAERHEWSGPR